MTNVLPLIESKRPVSSRNLQSTNRYKFLFENSPTPIHETNVSNVMLLIDNLKRQNITDIESYLAFHPEILTHLFFNSDIFDVNQAMIDLTEAENKAYYIENFKQVLGEPCSLFFKAVLVALFNGENQLSGETQITTFKGNKIWIEATAIFLSTGKEEIINYTFKDITEKKQIDEAIKLINNRLVRGEGGQKHLDNLVLALSEAFDLSYVFIGEAKEEEDLIETLAFSINQEIVPNGTCRFHNSPCKLVYSTKEMVIHHNHLDRIYPEHEVVQKAKGKSYLGFPLLSKEGNVIGHLSFINDKPIKNMVALTDVMGLYAAWASTELMHINAQRRLEIKTETIQNQLTELNEKNQELELYIESNSQLENFAYIASHDLKAPIRTIVSFSQLLERRLGEKMDEESKEYLDFVTSASKNMGDLIDDLLDYSKVDSQSNEVDEVDVNGLLSAITSEIQVNIKENDATIIWDNLPTINADLIKLKQVFQNLITNAIKFQKVGVKPIVEIKSEETPKHWQFSITDNGIGIKEEYFEDIFKLFQKLHTNESFEGTGLGLAICRKIIVQHEGEIWIESTHGSGTTFYFTLKK